MLPGTLAKNLVATVYVMKCYFKYPMPLVAMAPESIYINTYGSAKVTMSDGEITPIQQMGSLFMRPYAIGERFKLHYPSIQSNNLLHGEYRKRKSSFHRWIRVESKTVNVETFHRKKLDAVKD